jgi:hypothetical protein
MIEEAHEKGQRWHRPIPESPELSSISSNYGAIFLPLTVLVPVSSKRRQEFASAGEETLQASHVDGALKKAYARRGNGPTKYRFSYRVVAFFRP